MPLHANPDIPISWLGYNPVGTEEPIENWSGYRQLAPPSGVAAFYSKAVLFPACGWAFNSGGTEAINTCYVGGYDGPFGTPAVGYLYSILITEDVKQTPGSAVMSLDESGSYALSVENGIKYPNLTETGLEMDVVAFANGQEVIGDFKTPRYAFFDGDARKIVYSEKKSGNGSYEGGELVDSIPLPYSQHNAIYGGVSPCGYPDEQEIIMTGDLSNLGSYYVDLDIGGPASSSGTAADSVNIALSTTGKTIKCNFYIMNEYNWIGIRYAVVVGYPIKYERNDSEVYPDAIKSATVSVVPLGDREAIYTYTQTVAPGICYTSVGKELFGNAGVTRDGYPACASVYECKYTLTSPATGYYGGVTNRYLTTGPTGSCGPCSDRNDPALWYDYAIIEYDYAGQSTGRRLEKLYINSSGNINDELLWSRNTAIGNDDYLAGVASSFFNIPDSLNPQWMYVHRDNTQDGIIFGAKEMNAINYADQFSIGIDTTKYPLSTAPNFTINTFWVGDPHCVNNDCEV